MRSAVISPASKKASSFDDGLRAVAELLEPKLEELLPKEGRLAGAMRYAVLGAGKRFRPFLVLESAQLFGTPKHDALNAAAAIECLHCYSLVHDDLPAMDDDDVRRGRPTAHKVFGEATAILAGDALQALAFELLSQPATHPDAKIRNELTIGLAQASGASGMAGGQQLDLDATAAVEQMSSMKTGALIRYAALCGAILGDVKEADRRAIETYGEQLGRAFQISDDLLDAGKDAAIGKKTFVTSFGVVEAKKKLAGATEEALQALGPFGARALALQEAALYLLRRTH